MRKKISILLQLVVGLVVLFLILYTLNLGRLVQIFLKANIPLICLGVLAYLGLNFVNSFKLGLLVHTKGKLKGFKELFFINLAGMLASDVTPGRAGYFYTILLLRDRIKKARGTAALTIFQLTELIVKLVGALTAFFLLLEVFSGTNLPSYFFLALALILILTVLLLVLSFWKQAARLFSWSKRLSLAFSSFQEHARETRKVFLMALLLTLAGWFLRGIEWFFVARAVGLNLELFQAVLLHPLITIFAFLPVSIAGLGLVEFAGLTIISNLYPLPQVGESIFAFLILDRAMNVLVDLLGLGKLVGVE